MSRHPLRPSRNRRSLRFISRNLAICLALLTLASAAVLSSVLKRSRDDGGGGQAVAEVGGNYRESLEAKLSPPALAFPKPRTPMLRTAEAETSSAAPGASPGDVEQEAEADRAQDGGLQASDALPAPNRAERFTGERKPREERLKKGRTFDGDLRKLPLRRPAKRERPEREGPKPNPGVRAGTSLAADLPERIAPVVQGVPAPAPTKSFHGLDFVAGGSVGYPPDTVGDVGPTYYIQAVNTAVGIFRKSDGVRVAAFNFDTLMSQGHFGNLSTRTTSATPSCSTTRSKTAGSSPTSPSN